MSKFNMDNIQSQQLQGKEQSNIENSFKVYFEELNVLKKQLIKEFEKFQNQFDYQNNLKQLNTQQVNQESLKLLIEDFNKISKIIRCLQTYNMEKTLQLFNNQNQLQNQTRFNKIENEFNTSNQYEENKNNSENKNYQNHSNFSLDQSQYTSSIKKSETTKNQTLNNYQDSYIHDAVQQNKQSQSNYNPQNNYTKNQNGWNQNSQNYNSNLQQQQQLQVPQQKQIEQQIQYYVYEDLNNFMGVLTDVLETIEYFKNCPNHPYIPIAINRLVNQTNISNGVHMSCYQEYKDSEKAKIYLREKQVALLMFKEFQKKMNLSNKQTKLKECLESFEKNFNDTVFLNQIKDVQTESKGDFNLQVVDQIVTSIQNQEDTRNLIYEGKYKKLEKVDIEKNIKQRKERAQDLLKVNFLKK